MSTLFYNQFKSFLIIFVESTAEVFGVFVVRTTPNDFFAVLESDVARCIAADFGIVRKQTSLAGGFDQGKHVSGKVHRVAHFVSVVCYAVIIAGCAELSRALAFILQNFLQFVSVVWIS